MSHLARPAAYLSDKRQQLYLMQTVTHTDLFGVQPKRKDICSIAYAFRSVCVIVVLCHS